MSEATRIERIAKDFCDHGGNCLTCSAAISFECTPKKIAKRVYDLGYYRPIKGHWVCKDQPEIAQARTRSGEETIIRDCCSVCGNRSRDVGNFCSFCGAQLR